MDLKGFIILLLYINIAYCVGILNFFMPHKDEYIPEIDLPSRTLEIKWIEQPIDHFNSSDNRTFNMRYFTMDKYFKPNGPILLIIQSFEYEYSFKFKDVLDLAVEQNGIVILAEKRYFFESLPFENVITENLKYLTTKQILADVANLLKTLKGKTELANSKVLAFGYGYAGNHAIWMRALYPNLVDGAVAHESSVLAKDELEDIFHIVSDNIVKYCDKEDVDVIKKNQSRIDSLLSTPNGIETFKKEFKICKEVDLTRQENIDLTLKTIGLAGYAYIAKINPVEMKQYCKINLAPENINTNFHSDLIRRHHDTDDSANIKVEEVLVNKKSDDYCLYTEIDFVIHMIIISPYTSLPSYYLRCNEYGQYMSSNKNNNHIFTKRLTTTMQHKICKKIFDLNEEKMKANYDATNQYFGGIKPNVTNVVFVTSSLSLKRSVSIVKDLSPEARAFVIPLAKFDSYTSTDTESNTPLLTEYHRMIKKIISKWI